MVSLWPWKGEDNSPASFEKVLSALAAKISKSHSQLDSLRQRNRRLKALWTLYATISYIISVIILLLVVGWKNWSAVEYTAVAGSPLLIYLMRTGMTTYYNFRIDTVVQRLESQQAERAKTIDKLKTATKYNSTQELLEKYGGATPKPKKQAASTPSKSPKNVQKQPQRTSIGPPPPTANICRPNQITGQPSTPQPESRPPSSYVVPSQGFAPGQGPQAQAEFALNAFSAPPQYADGGGEINFGGRWYDRILDLLLGEDETLPKNRVALICQSCRLVNGQAPPGTKSLAELGKWKCFGCGVLNGEEDEAVKAVQEMKERILAQDQPVPDEVEDKVADEGAGADIQNDENYGDGEERVDGMEDYSKGGTVEVEPKQGRPKGSRKKR